MNKNEIRIYYPGFCKGNNNEKMYSHTEKTRELYLKGFSLRMDNHHPDDVFDSVLSVDDGYVARWMIEGEIVDIPIID